MEPDGDVDTHPSRLRASIQDRIHASAKLNVSARCRARTQARSAAAMYDRAEQQFARSMQQTHSEYVATLIGHDATRADLLHRVLDLATSLYPGVAASVTSVSGDDTVQGLRYATVAHTGIAAIADAAQYALEEGPCPEAVAADHVTVLGSNDLEQDTPLVWPRFSAAARHLGIRSAISVGIPWTSYWTGPADPDRPAVSAINFYAATPYEFFAEEKKAVSLGVHVGAHLTGADPAELYDPATLSIDA